MNNSVLKIGFIGGGINSAIGTTHKIASQMDGMFKIEAGCFSRHGDINKETAEICGIDNDRCYQNWQDLLMHEKDRLQAIVVLTPTPSHKEIVVEAIKNGYSVICDKTLVTSSQEALQIKKVVDEYNAFLAITYNYTGYPMLKELKAMIENNKLGKLTQIHIEMPQEGFARQDRNGNPQAPQEWRLKDTEIPIIALDLGSHIHNLIYYLSSEHPQELVGVSNSFGAFKQVQDNVICISKYSNDLVCNIWFSKSALGHRNGLRVRVYGEHGSAEWYQMDPELLIFNDNQGHTSIIDRSSIENTAASELKYNRFKAGHPSGFIEAFANQYIDIADSLHKYMRQEDHVSKFVFNVEHAVEGMHMLEAMTDSVKNMSWQPLKK